jgi:hypothetical protein
LRGQALYELQRRHPGVRAAVTPGRLQPEHYFPGTPSAADATIMKPGLLSDYMAGAGRHVLVTIGEDSRTIFVRETGMTLRKGSESGVLLMILLPTRQASARETRVCNETLHKQLSHRWLAATPDFIGALPAWETGGTGSGR